jgi:hypothetical protein
VIARHPSAKEQIMDDDGRGWLIFAGVVLMVAGVMRFFDALWAFHYHGALPQNLEDALFGHSLSTYGWLWLVVAIVVFLCGLGVMARSQVARWIGVAAGAIIAITSIWWIAYYPIWSLVYIGIGVMVMYALLAHGERVPAD